MLEYLDKRFLRMGAEGVTGGDTVVEKRNNPSRVRIHEKERQFMDAFKLIIQSGYTIDEKDFMQVLRFINVEEVIQQDDYEKIR